GLPGLVAANRLAAAGHEVTVFEKSERLGGRLATYHPGGDRKICIDHGASYLSAGSPEFGAFLEELESLGLVRPWTNKFLRRDEDTLTEVAALPSGDDIYAATDGMGAISRYLSRPVQIWTDSKVGGVTYLGRDRDVKKAWMVNTNT